MRKLMLGLMIAFAVAAEAEVLSGVRIGNLSYDLDTEAKTATICGYDDLDTPLTKIDVGEVEWMWQKYTVTAVGERGLAGCESLTSVSLPNATAIGANAFVLCGSLKEVSMPNAATIGERAFWRCGSLKEVSLPNATTIGEYAFADCGLTSVSLPNAATVGASVFNKCSSLVSVSFPKVKTIEQGFFRGFENLTVVDLSSATTIGWDAFQNCSSLTSISLPSATTIGADAFDACDKLDLILTNGAMKDTLNGDRSAYGLRTDVRIRALTKEQVEAAAWTQAVLCDGLLISGNDYGVLCSSAGLTPKTAPQVVQEGEVAVTKESIAAAKAEIVNIANGMVYLGVSVCSNADITASSANWAPVKFTKDTQIGLSADGTKLILPIPVAAQQGFMILQSGNSKVSEGGRGPVIGEPWYKPTVED